MILDNKRDYLKVVGEKIQVLREDADYSQKELAAKLNLTDKQLSKYETGNSQCSFATLVSIAEFFHVKVDFLLGLENRKTKNMDGSQNFEYLLKPGDIKLLQEVHQISPEGRKLILASAKLFTEYENHRSFQLKTTNPTEFMIAEEKEDKNVL